MGVFVQRARSDAVGLRWSTVEACEPRERPRRARHDRRPGHARDRRMGDPDQVHRLPARRADASSGSGEAATRASPGERRSGCRPRGVGSTTRGSRSPGQAHSRSGPTPKSGNIRLATSTDGGAHWSTKTIGSTNAHAGRPREGRSGLPDLGASGQNLAITWYTNDQGRQVVLTSATGGDDLDAGSTPTVLATTSPPNGIRYGGAAGATDGASNRVAVAYTTRRGSRPGCGTAYPSDRDRPWSRGPWPPTGKPTRAASAPPSCPVGRVDLMVAFAGCRARADRQPVRHVRPGREDRRAGGHLERRRRRWSSANAITDAAKQPYRTNAEPSLALSGVDVPAELRPVPVRRSRTIGSGSGPRPDRVSDRGYRPAGCATSWSTVPRSERGPSRCPRIGVSASAGSETGRGSPPTTACSSSDAGRSTPSACGSRSPWPRWIGELRVVRVRTLRPRRLMVPGPGCDACSSVVPTPTSDRATASTWCEG